jgi:hypothetical protein
MRAQHNTPLFWVNQYDPSVIDPATGNPKEFRLQLTNLGLAVRPDLTDSHTVHWHGFRNVIPFYDGEPTTSLSVPVGSNFTYVYRPREPGSYMYHCHVEDVEHVHGHDQPGVRATYPEYVRRTRGRNTDCPAWWQSGYHCADGLCLQR